MSQYKILNFIKWALTHAELKTIPTKAVLPMPRKECGGEPWHYLFGTVRTHTTKAVLEERWKNHYSKSWSREAYDNATAGFYPNDYATDCQGLLDAWLTYEAGEKTDINADMNYKHWCEAKGKISEMERPFIVGEAVFMAGTNGRMTHVGWVCGFDANGDVLVVEARGIWYGVVVTRLDDRAWSHRGLMTKKFNYDDTEEEENMTRLLFEVSSPMHTGEEYRTMQAALNAAGYTDASGKKLDEDGKWGKKSQQAFDALIADYASADVAPPAKPEPITAFCIGSDDGAYKLAITVAKTGEE